MPHSGLLALVACPILALALLAAGCGGGQPSASDTDRLVGLVSALSDAAKDADACKKLFAADAAPKDADRARYARYNYELKSSQPSGEQCTLTVAVRDVGSGKELGEAQWTAVRVDGQWKLQSAPLP